MELIYFAATIANDKATLNWTTASETNNLGFDIEISSDNRLFKKIAFVPGFGTSTEEHNYAYSISQPLSLSTYFRLKQINFDGSFKYSAVVEVDALITSEFILNQNFPNPFNPTTQIRFSIPRNCYISLIIYNLRGEKVTTLLEGYKQTGNYMVSFDGANLASGVYFYRLKASNFDQTKKFVLLK